MRSLLLSLLVVPLAACGSGANEPVWIDLAEGFEPRELIESARAWSSVENDGSEVRVSEDEEGVWVSTTLGKDAWTKEELPGGWSVARPWSGAFACTGGGPTRLVVDGRTFRVSDGNEAVVAGLYFLANDRIFAAVEAGSGPPTETVFSIAASAGSEENGVWRVRTLDHTGSGIPVYDGVSEELEVNIPPASALRFTTVFEQLPFGLDEDHGGDPPTTTFRVRLDGAVLWEGHALGSAETHSIALDSTGPAKLTFEIEGAVGRGVFYVPSIGPRDVGEYGARPWPGDRPNLVLFIADTFRADNLAIYGGPAELTPELNAFADESRRFLSARSTSSWTLPSIASILTGLFPPQHGATRGSLTVSRTLTTLGETLQRFGYRTVAVTDSGYFSPPFGLDQGFELFFENRIHHWHLTKTIDQALSVLDHDDGRPLFLVVHTYRAHGPFRTGPEEDSTAFDEFVAFGAGLMNEKEDRLLETRKATLMPYLKDWVALYEAGVSDLDFKFGRFRRETEARGVLSNGYLLFTGDHGQAHGENNDVAHGGKLWESKLRIPMLLYGQGLGSEDVRTLVSLIDIAPTFGRLAGVPRESDWVGISLLELEADRSTFAFRLEGPNADEVTIQSGGHKLSALPDPEALRRGEVSEAFDLTVDPGELNNIRDESWPSELAREMADAVEFFLRAKSDPDAATADADMRRRLQDIGYTGS